MQYTIWIEKRLIWVQNMRLDSNDLLYESKVKNNLSEKLLLYAITDRNCLKDKTFFDAVCESLDGGITFLQMREKSLDHDGFYKEALVLKKLANEYNVPFIINDNVDVAVRINADGVHVGQSDMEAGKVRSLIGSDKILGVSVTTVEQAIIAEKNGADYLGVGAVFSTQTKEDASEVSLATLKDICNTVSIPVVAIGGITLENAHLMTDSGISGIAVVSAIYAQNDIYKTTTLLRKIAADVVKKEI